MAIDLVKENIEYEQFLGESSSDSVIKAEYVIPDTLPDVREILMLDTKPSILSAEIMQGKIYVEGQILYNIFYLGKDEKTDIFCVSYTGKFTNYIEFSDVDNKMSGEYDCYIEHIECNCINERKISIEGIILTKAKVIKNCYFDIVKDIIDSNDIQLLKTPTSIDKIIGNVKGELIGKSHIVIPMDNPQIGSIMKLDVKLHKREIKIIENKIQADAFVFIEVFYKGTNSREIEYISDDILIRQEMELEGINPSMECFGNFVIDNIEHNIKEDDLGEKRIMDVEINVKATVKVITKENMEIIQDAYSPAVLLNMSKKDYKFNIVHGTTGIDTIVKENISIKHDDPKPVSILFSEGNISITDKKLLENKVVIDGLLQVKILFLTDDEERFVSSVEEEVPFSCTADIPGTKIDMNCFAEMFLEGLEASLEADTIAIKAVVNAQVNVSYDNHRDFIIDVQESEGETLVKKSSITIYSVQPGDTMWKIAKKYSTPVDTLATINSIDDIDNIDIGEKLIIPGRAII